MKRNRSICEAVIGEKNGRTILLDSYYTAPFKIMNPFRDGRKTTVMIMTASAGMLAGDDYEQKFLIRENTDITITGQGYTKVFHTKDDYCSNSVEIEMEGNSVFRYLPHPTIPFAGSDYRGRINARLAKESTFVFMDILAAGRVAGEEVFQMKRYRNQLQVWIEARLVFLDRMLIDPQRINYRSIGFFDEYTHAGMMFLYRPQQLDVLLEQIRQMRFGGKFGATYAKEGILVRALANSGEELESFFLDINHLI